MNLMTFSNDSTIRCFISKFIASESTQTSATQLDTNQLFTLQFYHCLVKDTMHALGIYVDLLMVGGARGNSKFVSNDGISFFRL